MLSDTRPTAAEMRVMKAQAARVREQNAERAQRPLPRLTWTPPTVEPIEDADQIAVAS